jgi:hypothetical protein
MPAEAKMEIELEIAHVLFLDIVGYSKLSVNERHGRVDQLNGIVRLSEQFQKAEAAVSMLRSTSCKFAIHLFRCMIHFTGLAVADLVLVRPLRLKCARV